MGKGRNTTPSAGVAGRLKKAGRWPLPLRGGGGGGTAGSTDGCTGDGGGDVAAGMLEAWPGTARTPSAVARTAWARAPASRLVWLMVLTLRMWRGPRADPGGGGGGGAGAGVGPRAACRAVGGGDAGSDPFET